MRKLATIQRISAIRPIEGADKIEVADVLGWSVVVGKGEFQAGDLAVYFEIDSWLDASNPAFASFEDRFTNWGTKRGMRPGVKREGLVFKSNTDPFFSFKAISNSYLLKKEGK